MSKYEAKIMYNFEKYLDLQSTGAVNMVSPKVREILGISESEHRFILQNYSELKQEYDELKVVDELLKDAKARVDGDKAKEKGLVKDEPHKSAE